jgi:uncharacterized phosphosugar-binding protein
LDVTKVYYLVLFKQNNDAMVMEDKESAFIMKNFDVFYRSAMDKLETVKQQEHDAVKQAAEMFAACMADNGIIQLVGVDHGRSLAMELGYRAGGLMPFHQFNAKDLAVRGILTKEDIQPAHFNNEPSYAQKWIDLYRIEQKDMFLLTSRTGSEPVLIELAKIVKAHGHKIIAVLSVKAMEAAQKKDPKADNIRNYAQLVIDTCTDAEDTVVDVDGKHKAGQLNTICGNVLAQMITAETYRYLKNHDMACPVLLSVNVKGADAYNRKISDQYIGRWNS